MADKYPLANGNWSDAANWNDGTKPVAGDNVYADGKTVTVDEDATVASVRTTQRSGGTAGGGFTLAAGITLTADVIAGTTPCMTRNAAGADSYVVGNVTGGSSSYSYGVYNVSTGTVSITGDVSAGSTSTSLGIYNSSTGTISITGDVSGGSASNSYGVNNASTGTISITGNVSAGTSGGSHGVYSTTYGHIRLAGNQVCSVSGAAVGTQAVCVRKLAMSDGDNTTTAYAEAGDLLGTYSGETVSHYGLLVGPFGHPATADVRDGTVYGPSAELEGTLAVPAAGSVALGVPVDATEGTAVLTQAAVEAAAAAAIADAGLATEAKQDEIIADVAAINPGTGTGTNTIQFEITNGDGTLLENATVSLRLNDILKATGDTAATGRLSGTGLAVQATGTYELSVTCDGYNGHTADLVVTAGVNTLVEVELTALAITAPTDTGTATGRLDMHAKDTTTGAYQSIYVRQTTRRTATGHGDSKEWRELVSNALGVIEAPFWKSQSYEAKRGRDGTAVAFTVGTDDVFYLPSVLGEP